MRAFFSVNLSDAVKGAISRAIGEAPISNPPWRWISTENLHITLKFLGEINEAWIREITDCAVSACSGIAGFSIAFDRFGAFPSLKRPRILFYSASRGADKLQTLVSSLESTLHANMGIAKESRPFKAHVTLARVKATLPDSVIEKLEAFPALHGISQHVDSIFLMRSELRRSGARYYQVKEIELSGAKC
jgi:2'-5' RNA ligase